MRSDCWRLSVRLGLGGVMLSTLFSLFTRPVLGKPQDASQSDLQQMQKKVDQLEQQLQDLKQQMASATHSAAPDSASGQASAAKQPKSDSTVDFYGFAMLDSGYQFNTNDPNWFDVVRPTKLPAFKGEFAPDGKVFYGVRQTRFGVKAFTPTTFGDLKTIFEFELFGTGVDTGQTTFRLRHAYGELGHFGAGQTWSPFMDIDVFPNSAGPDRARSRGEKVGVRSSGCHIQDDCMGGHEPNRTQSKWDRLRLGCKHQLES